MSLRVKVITVAVSLLACLAYSSPALAETTQEAKLTRESVDSSYSECLQAARYEGENIMCMIDAFYQYNDLAEHLPHSDYGNQAYETQLDACSEVEDTPTSLECAVLAAKSYLHDGDVMQSKAPAVANSKAALPQ